MFKKIVTLFLSTIIFYTMFSQTFYGNIILNPEDMDISISPLNENDMKNVI